MAWWYENVFLRLLVSFALGIFVAEHVPFSWWPAFAVPPLALTGVALVQSRNYRVLLRLRRIREPLVHTTLLSAGFLAAVWLDPCHHPRHYCSHTGATHYVARISEPPQEKNKVVRVKAQLIRAIYNDAPQAETFGHVYVYLRKTERALTLTYGDVLVIDNTLQPAQADPNPHAIDYRFILHNKHIYRTGFLNDRQWLLLPEKQPNWFYAFALDMRHGIFDLLQRHVPNGYDAVAASLLLGYRDALDFDVENAYASAGVVHIMAVSGMHVGLVFMLFSGILGLRWFNRMPEFVRRLLLLAFVWFFATITGFTGSVVRASSMLSIYIVGVNTKRWVSPHNILFASAFVLLAWKPRLLFDVGFELSFFAVAGILTFQKPLYNLVHVHNPVLDWMVRMMSISAAAQLGTLPLILFYFHQFPVHFLLANLLVVPLAVLMLYGMLMMLAVGWWSGAAALIGWVLSHGFALMNTTVFFIRDLPLSVYRIHHFPFWMAMATGLLIWLAYRFLMERRARDLHQALFVGLLVCVYSVAMYVSDGLKRDVVQFRHDKQPVVSIRKGREAVLIRPREADFRVGAFDRYLEQYYQREGVTRVKQVFADDTSRLHRPFDWLSFDGNMAILPEGILMIDASGTAWWNSVHDYTVAVETNEAPNRIRL